MARAQQWIEGQAKQCRQHANENRRIFTAKFLCHHRRQRNEQSEEQGGNQFHDDEFIARITQLGRAPCHGKNSGQVKHHKGTNACHNAQNQGFRMLGNHLFERHFGFFFRIQYFLEGWGFSQFQAHPQAHQHQQSREQERHTPAPGKKLLFGQNIAQ